MCTKYVTFLCFNNKIVALLERGCIYKNKNHIHIALASQCSATTYCYTHKSITNETNTHILPKTIIAKYDNIEILRIKIDY